jgi:hypothetical protein
MVFYLALILSFIFNWGNESSPGKTPWLILYTSYAKIEDLKPFDPIVFALHDHPRLDDLDKNKTIYAPLNIHSLFVKYQGFASSQHAIAQDMSSWINYMIDQEIAPLIEQGFNGIFFDGFNELKTAFEKMQIKFGETITQFFLLIGQRFPELSKVTEVAPDIFDYIGNAIDGVIKFSVLTSYDAVTGEYMWLDPLKQNENIAQLVQIQEKYPELEIFTVDFWDLKDKKTISKIYSMEQTKGFRPYVGNIELNKIVLNEKNYFNLRSIFLLLTRL